MADSDGLILALNGGSSSIKFALFAAGQPCRLILRGAFERIGSEMGRFELQENGGADTVSRSVATADHDDAVAIVLDMMASRCGVGRLVAVGHRIVHGGADYGAPQRVDEAMIKALRRLSPFDPKHLPDELRLVEAARTHFPGVPQIACFDTAFHHDMPRLAQIVPIPRGYEAKGVRRFGFHGLSYNYLMGELARIAGPDAANGRVILAHLGSGASLAAVKAGRPIDTSMGLTPASGIPMGTRSGDIDPGLSGYLARTENMTADAYDMMVNAQSGLLGISETSSDIRHLLAIEDKDARAAEAVGLFCYQVRKWIGGFAAVLGGVDTLVFSGGIGEHSATVRARICADLGFLGIYLDDAVNAVDGAIISTNQGGVTVRVMPTDEEGMIANLVCGVLASSGTNGPIL